MAEHGNRFSSERVKPIVICAVVNVNQMFIILYKTTVNLEKV